MTVTSADLRKKYLDFFATKQHAIIPSAPLVPENDPSVLFNTAGMQPLVPYLLGQPHPFGKRLADVQKCVRTGDIDDVGDNSHLTFFEMLGNWSLGDYFKKESINWSWEFLTSPQWLGLNPKMISVTVFEGDQNAPKDEESASIWKELGMPEDKIAYLPAEDNWWAAGPTGPCGPDTEIFYYLGEGLPPEGSNKGTDSKNWMEIWNNVFMQYNRVDENTLNPLPAPCVDTGMGLERTVATLNGVKTVYATDAFADALEAVKNLVKENYVERSARIVVDHVRTGVHMIADGVYPKNVEQGYILRRLLRRAIREMHRMKYEQASLGEVAKVYIEKFSPVYDSVKNNATKILEELAKEEEKFGKTIHAGEKQFYKLAQNLKQQNSAQLSGEDAFDLFQTYGFPLEMTEELAKENGVSIDKEGFQKAFTHHQELSRTATEGKFKGGLADTSEENVAYHTMAHLMLAGLRKTLGDHVNQSGSNITAERIRFDFSHGEKVTDEQLRAVETYVNNAILAPCSVSFVEMNKEEARAKGVSGMFWERYPDIVKVYTITGPSGEIYSQEICGGPHIETTKGLKTFKIVKEESSSSGVRRIKAVLE